MMDINKITPDIEAKIFDRMLNYFPEKDLEIISGCSTFTSVKQAHDSFGSQLKHAGINTRVRERYLSRCYEWLVLLKKNNVQLINKL